MARNGMTSSKQAILIQEQKHMSLIFTCPSYLDNFLNRTDDFFLDYIQITWLYILSYTQEHDISRKPGEYNE